MIHMMHQDHRLTRHQRSSSPVKARQISTSLPLRSSRVKWETTACASKACGSHDILIFVCVIYCVRLHHPTVHSVDLLFVVIPLFWIVIIHIRSELNMKWVERRQRERVRSAHMRKRDDDNIMLCRYVYVSLVRCTIDLSHHTTTASSIFDLRNTY